MSDNLGNTAPILTNSTLSLPEQVASISLAPHLSLNNVYIPQITKQTKHGQNNNNSPSCSSSNVVDILRNVPIQDSTELPNSNQSLLYNTTTNLNSSLQLFNSVVEMEHIDIRCPICTESFTALNEFIDHIIKHEITHIPAWFCIDCESIFDSVEQLLNHMAAAHTGQSFKCKMCLTSFDSQQQLLEHFKDKHNNLYASYRCRICPNQEFHLMHFAISHLLLHNHFECMSLQTQDNTHLHQKPNFFVATKNSQQANANRRGASKRIVQDKLLNTKPIPSTSTNYLQSIKESSPKFQLQGRANKTINVSSPSQAVQQNKGTDSFCYVCKTYFLNLVELQRHMRVHTKRCPICVNSYNNFKMLNTHIFSHYFTFFNKYLCSDCGEIFYKENEYYEHLFKKHSSTEYVCCICNSRFGNIYEFQKHIEVSHSVVHQHYQCKDCPTVIFSNKVMAVLHMLMHQMELYSCMSGSVIPSPTLERENNFQNLIGIMLLIINIDAGDTSTLATTTPEVQIAPADSECSGNKDLNKNETVTA